MKEIKNKFIEIKDSFQNFLLQYGKGTNNATSANHYGYNPLTNNRLQCEWMFRGSWICKAAVEIPAQDMCKTGITLHGIESDNSDIIQKEISDMNIWQSISDCLKWARLYGGSLGYIMIDGQDASTPLDISTIREGQFKGIMPLGRYQVNPSMGDLIEEYGPDFGLPRYYTILATNDLSGSPQIVHHTRFLRFIGIQMPYYQKTALMFWGLSVLENLQDRLEAYDMISTGINQLANKAHLRTLKITNLRDNIAAGDEALDNILKYVHQLRITQTNEGITLIDAEDDFETQVYSFGGLSEILNLAGEQISGALGIPQSRLFGRQITGLSGSSEGDEAVYFDNISQKRELELRRPIYKIVQIIAQMKGIKLDDSFRFSFDSLCVQQPNEIAEIASKFIDTISKAYQAGIISIEEAREQLQGVSLQIGMFNNLQINKIPEPINTPKEGAKNASNQ